MSKRRRGRPRKMTSDNLNDGLDGAKATVGSDGKVPLSDDLPEFFTFYAPAICSERLRIPPDFVKKFDGDIPTTVTLNTPSGPSFQVTINRINEHLFLQQGWPEFVQEKSLEDDDILTFCYAGNSIFFVKVFAVNGCKKIDDDTISRTSGRKPTENLEGYESSEREDSKQNIATKRNLSPKRSIARKYPCKKPSFSVVMSKYYLKNGCLYIPKEYWSVHMRNDGNESRKATLWIKNKSWSVELLIRTDRIQFSTGWRYFVIDNSLKNGNLCTFQKIDGNDDAFKVTVKR